MNIMEQNVVFSVDQLHIWILTFIWDRHADHLQLPKLIITLVWASCMSAAYSTMQLKIDISNRFL